MNNQKKILVTGASGFIGRALVNELVRAGKRVVAMSRSTTLTLRNSNVELLAVADLADFNNAKLLEGIDCIVHLAGIAHFTSTENPQFEATLMRANRDATCALAESAARVGVRRFILLSSIGVLGKTSRDGVFDDDTPVAPHNAYARSKLSAEQGLWKIVHDTQLEGVVLRPPLVYGPGAKGSLATLIAMLRLRLPVPLGAIHNRRSLIGLGNLIDLIQHCIEKPEASGKTYVVSDHEVVTTTELIRRIATAINTKVLLIPVPARLLTLAARFLGKADMAEQLVGNLEIDSSRVRADLDWEPPFTFEQGLAILGNELDKNS